MNANDPLANLRDIHLPDSVSWWPIAYGWWLIIFLVIAAISWLVYKLWQKHQHKQLYRNVSSMFQAINQQYQAEQDSGQLIKQYSQLLRRLMLKRTSRSQVAGLTGKEWIESIHTQCQKPIFDQSTIELLIAGPYQRNIQISDFDKLKNSIEECIAILSQGTELESNHA